jgi:hypothetical protein
MAFRCWRCDDFVPTAFHKFLIVTGAGLICFTLLKALDLI